MRQAAHCQVPVHRLRLTGGRPASAALARIAVLASIVLAWGAAAETRMDAQPDRPPQGAQGPALVHTLHEDAHRAWTQASPESRQVAAWIQRSGDNRGWPFVLVDKRQAQVFVFSAEARLLGATSALLGLAKGDDSVPGIGQKPLSRIQPHERTTPAGRFEASLAYNLSGHPILWVDYETAISLHALRGYNPREQRSQRLTSPSALDNRISYGCINVAPSFFDDVVKKAFQDTEGVVYVLPETRSLASVFAPHGFELAQD